MKTKASSKMLSTEEVSMDIDGVLLSHLFLCYRFRKCSSVHSYASVCVCVCMCVHASIVCVFVCAYILARIQAWCVCVRTYVCSVIVFALILFLCISCTSYIPMS